MPIAPPGHRCLGMLGKSLHSKHAAVSWESLSNLLADDFELQFQSDITPAMRMGSSSVDACEITRSIQSLSLPFALLPNGRQKGLDCVAQVSTFEGLTSGFIRSHAHAMTICSSICYLYLCWPSLGAYMVAAIQVRLHLHTCHRGNYGRRT